MISERYARKYCKEDISLIENYDKAINDNTQKWHCHHRGEILPCGVYSPEDLNKFGLYWKRPSRELIFMTLTEHNKLHRKHPLKTTREKISKAQIGKHHSEKTKNKISESRIGKHHSEKTKNKISESKMGNHNKPTKPILQYTKEGEFIKEWISCMEASRVLGIAQSSITKCCKGKLKSAG